MSTPDPVAPDPAPRKGRRWPLVVAALLVIGALAGGGIYEASRPPAPPGTPGGVEADAETCAPPKCKTIGSQITLTWTAPRAGGPVTGYRLTRNGFPLKQLPGDTLKYIDPGLSQGVEYAYRVQAVGSTELGAERLGPQSEIASAKTPLPPITSARLSGRYDVRLTFRSVRNLGRFEGVDSPAVGDEHEEQWEFTPTCSAAFGACETDWFGLGPLRVKGRTYDGTVVSHNATCDSRRNVPTRTHLHLTATDAKREIDSFVVTQFRGSITVSFHCGGPTSQGVATVEGSRGV